VAKNKRKITVLLLEAEYERFERYCEAKGFKKSTLLARLIREHLDTEHFASQTELSFDPQHNLGNRKRA